MDGESSTAKILAANTSLPVYPNYELGSCLMVVRGLVFPFSKKCTLLVLFQQMNSIKHRKNRPSPSAIACFKSNAPWLCLKGTIVGIGSSEQNIRPVHTFFNV